MKKIICLAGFLLFALMGFAQGGTQMDASDTNKIKEYVAWRCAYEWRLANPGDPHCKEFDIFWERNNLDGIKVDNADSYSKYADTLSSTSVSKFI